MRRFLHDCLTSCLIGTLLVPWSVLHGSTQAGELEIVQVDPDSGTLVARILFMEYFSAPGEFQPGMVWRNPDQPFSERTLWMIDGRPVRWQVGAAALEPGDRVYNYTSRSTPEFIDQYSHAPVWVGRVQRMVDRDTVEILRLAIRRYDTDAAVYIRSRHSIDADALYRLNGAPSDAGRVLGDNHHFVRILPDQRQIISAFTEEALLPIAEADESQRGTRRGLIVDIDADEKGRPSAILADAAGATEARGLDRKGYAVCDGNFLWNRSPLLRPGQMGTFFAYRGWTDKAKYALVRSDVMGALDGRIESVAGDRITVNVDGIDEKVEIAIAADATFQLDGRRVPRQAAVREGLAVTVFRERPMVVDGWTSVGQPAPGYAESGKDAAYAIIEYGPDGVRRVLKDGFNPYFDDQRVQDNPPRRRRLPMAGASTGATS